MDDSGRWGLKTEDRGYQQLNSGGTDGEAEAGIVHHKLDQLYVLQ